MSQNSQAIPVAHPVNNPLYWHNLLEKAALEQDAETVSHVATLYKTIDLGLDNTQQIITKAQRSYGLVSLTPAPEYIPNANQKSILSTLQNIHKINQVRAKIGVDNTAKDPMLAAFYGLGIGALAGFIISPILFFFIGTGILGVIIAAGIIGGMIGWAMEYASHKKIVAQKTKTLETALAAIPNEPSTSNSKNAVVNVNTHTQEGNLKQTSSAPLTVNDNIFTPATTNGAFFRITNKPTAKTDLKNQPEAEINKQNARQIK
jgi:hypothetical protein